MPRFSISTMLKGAAMGIAEVIPGVSGGTIAFITGIYETLIDSVKSFDLQVLKLLAKGKFRKAFEHVNGLFLVNLVFGMVIGAVVSIFVVTHLLEHYPPIIWGFFFGLIIASSVVILRQISGMTPALWGIVLLGAIIAFGIVQLSPATGSTSLVYVFFSGMLAICALILPGISGSFILLLLGMYLVIIPTIKSFISTLDTSLLSILVVFGLGCAVGLAGFSRILSWAFKRYHNPILALLCGFMIGSLWKIWPWRNPTSWINEITGNTEFAFRTPYPLSLSEEIKLLTEQNVLPGEYEMGSAYPIVTVFAIAIGFFLVFGLDHYFGRKLPSA